MNKLLVTLFCLTFGFLSAQERLAVQRCADIDRLVPIQNIHIDIDNNKWVADAEGLFLAQSPDFASVVDPAVEEWSLLSAPDGNEELNFSQAALIRFMGDNFTRISTAHLDKVRQELWIGTKDAGIYRFQVKPELQLIEHLHSRNSKLRSDVIQTIYITPTGQVLIGTDDGILEVSGKKSDLLGKYFDINAITYHKGVIWVVGDNEVLEMDKKGRFYGFDFDSRMIEGDVVDIAFDSEGKLWIASEIIVRYDFDEDKYEVFGPAEEFTSQAVNCIAVDSDDALWVGTYDKGVYFIGKRSSFSATLVVDDPLGCDAGSQNASLQVRASGGQPPYTYQWSGGLAGENPKNLGPGDYMVTITDQNGRSTEAQATIEDPRMTVTITQEKEAGHGGEANGQASVKVSGGNPRYRFTWDNGETTQVARQLSAGPHSVTITDRSGCSTTANITISETLATLQVALEKSGSNNCKGEAGASVKALVTGGQAPYQYAWSTGASGEMLNKLAAGTYQITVTDQAGNTTGSEIVIEELAELTASVTAQSPANTNVADGKAKVSATGGSGSYTYRWDNGETTETAVKLGAGTRTVTITDSNGCTVSASVEMSEDILPLSVELNTESNINCAGENTAKLLARVNGGKAPFAYQWNVGSHSGESASGLSAGDYQVTVTDAAGNAANANISIEDPTPITATITVKSPASTDEADGKATVKVKGGAGKYTYRWDNGETSSTASQLAAGLRSITITDEKGCSHTASVEIGEDIQPLAIELQQNSEIQCSGTKTAGLTAQISGGKAPFKYQWSTGHRQSERVIGLAAGSYQLTVTDVAGNTAQAEITVQEPEKLSASITLKSPASTDGIDGKATVKVSGGAGKYKFSWDNGEIGHTATQLAPGLRTVTVTDQQGCTTTASIEVKENIEALVVNLQETGSIKCAGDQSAELRAEVSGGKGPFLYQWNTGGVSSKNINGLPAGNYSLTVTDAAGNAANAEISVSEPTTLSATAKAHFPATSNTPDGEASVQVKGGAGNYSYQWDNGEIGQTATKLTSGLRTVTVTDINGCSITASVEIEEKILPLAIKLKQNNSIKCAGDRTGALELEVNGGKGPFNYQWSAGDAEGLNANNLPAGDYQVTVTDVVGTSKVAALSISQPEELSLSVAEDSPASANNTDGKASVRVRGGSGNYIYEWSNGETNPKAENLAPGKHQVTVTDDNGCSISGEVEIKEVILPLEISLNTQSSIKCAGEKMGMLKVEVKGGKAPFKYQWNTAGLEGNSVSRLAAGAYAVTVSDASGMQQEAEIEITEPVELTVEMAKNKPVTNENTKDGKATLTVLGGTPPYNYIWDNEEIGPSASNLTYGPHSVTVTDANRCHTTLNFETDKRILPQLTMGMLSAGQTMQVSRLYFEADSTEMTPDSYPALDEIAEFLEENPMVVIEVGGHTNNIPPAEYCDQLSTARAKSVATYITQKGIDPNRVIYQGYGKRKPKYSNRTDDGRQKNQRVEIKILKIN